MKQDNLLEKLSVFGFSLLDTDKQPDANQTLAGLTESRDPRLWEGFPVVLANVAQKGLFNNKVTKELLRTADRAYFDSLLAMSLALYKSLGLKFSWFNKLYSCLSAEGERLFAGFFVKFKDGREFKVAKYNMSGQKIKNTFNNYFNRAQLNLNELLAQKEELGLEYALAQVFSPKQKELFLKKLKREKLTKTEKEYFSRTVKKKVLALANTNLHRLSRKLLEESG